VEVDVRKSIKVTENCHRLIEEMRGRLPIGAFVEMLVLAHKAERPEVEAESAEIEHELAARASTIADKDVGIEVPGVELPPRDMLDILKDYSIEYALQFALGQQKVAELPGIRALNIPQKTAWTLEHCREIAEYYKRTCPVATRKHFVLAEHSLIRALRLAYNLSTQDGGQP
jgi:hypothetical protein